MIPHEASVFSRSQSVSMFKTVRDYDMSRSVQLKLKPLELAKRLYGDDFATTSAIPLERVVSNKNDDYFNHLECIICKGLIVNPLECVKNYSF
jgi:hypothetical protein